MALFYTALVFIALLEFTLTTWVGFWFPAFLAVTVAGVHFWRQFKSVSLSLLAFLLSGTGVSYLYGSNNPFLSQVAIVVTCFVLWGLMVAYRRRLYSFAVAVTFLLFFCFLFAMTRLYMLSHTSLPIILSAIFIMTSSLFFLSVKVALPALGQMLKVRLSVFSLLVGFLIGEAYAIFSKLPFTIITIDFMLFIIYYTMWSMAVHYFSGTFTKRLMIGSLTLCAFSFAVLLLSAAWM